MSRTPKSDPDSCALRPRRGHFRTRQLTTARPDSRSCTPGVVSDKTATSMLASSMAVEVQQLLFGNEGKPSGAFLKALLRLDSEQLSGSEPIISISPEGI